MNRNIFEEDDTQLIGKFLKDIYYPHSKKYKLDMGKNRKYNDQMREIFNQELKWRRELIVGEYYHYRTVSASHYGNVDGDHYIKVILRTIKQTESSKLDNSFSDNTRYLFDVVQNNMTVNIGYTTLSRNILRFNIIDNNIENIMEGTNFWREYKKLSTNTSLQELINYEICCEWMRRKIRTHDLVYRVKAFRNKRD
jgi:hypothetical protein